MIKNPFIFKVLDINTGHMTHADNGRLQQEVDKDGQMPVYELKDIGWLVYVGEIHDNWNEMSSEFRDVLMQARELGCDYVRFDRDGQEYYELPTFGW